ncbi:MAG: mechanosensitive ion channel family protein [Kiritimatiellae bacterium]|nr:mechanosensitive ion channel family protein [Kiritimatiellia bacterium]
MATNLVTNATNLLTNAAGGSSAVEVMKKELQQNQEMITGFYSWVVEHGPALAMNLLLTIVVFLVGWAVIAGLTKALRLVLNKTKLNELVTNFLLSVAHKVMWCLLLMIVLKRIGIDITPLIAGLGVTGFILGFAFKDALGNLAAGLMIAVNQPFKVGDFISCGGKEGTVKALNMTMTELATADGKRVIVPNGVVWGAPITNFSTISGYRRVDLIASVSYRSDVDKVKRVLRTTITAIPGVVADPAPVIEILEMGPSSVNFAVRPFCAAADYWSVYFAANQAIKAAFDLEGIEIPFQQMDVHVKESKV